MTTVERLRRQAGRLPGECTWCGQRVAGRRKTWCSDACVEEYRLQYNWTYIRERVYRRDRGVCHRCGCDTEKLERIARRLRRESTTVYRAFLRWLRSLGFHPRGRSLWDADHIHPRVLGGTHSLDNLRTLCVPCHKEVTAELQRSRAHSRRKAA